MFRRVGKIKKIVENNKKIIVENIKENNKKEIKKEKEEIIEIDYDTRKAIEYVNSVYSG